MPLLYKATSQLLQPPQIPNDGHLLKSCKTTTVTTKQDCEFCAVLAFATAYFLPVLQRCIQLVETRSYAWIPVARQLAKPVFWLLSWGGVGKVLDSQKTWQMSSILPRTLEEEWDPLKTWLNNDWCQEVSYTVFFLSFSKEWKGFLFLFNISHYYYYSFFLYFSCCWGSPQPPSQSEIQTFLKDPIPPPLSPQTQLCFALLL